MVKQEMIANVNSRVNHGMPQHKKIHLVKGWLFDAVEKDDLAEVKQLLSVFPGLVNVTRREGRVKVITLQHKAVETRDVSMVLLLISFGAISDVIDSSVRSPLDIAIHNQDYNIARVLRREGAH